MEIYVVTGATGFLGNKLCAALLGAGHNVIALGRNKDEAENLVALGARFYSVDLRDENKLFEALNSVDNEISCIVHSAALSSDWGPRKLFQEINVEGTKKLIQVAKRIGIRDFIYISSPSIYFDFQDGFDLNESTPIANPAPSFYSESKYQGEKVVQENLDENFKAIILRPRGFFGPGDKTLLPKLMRAYHAGRLKIIGDGKTLIDLTYIDNVVHSILLSLDKVSEHSGEAFNITNDDPVLLWEFVNNFMIKTGNKPIVKKMNYNVVFFIAGLLEGIYGLLKLKKGPAITRYSCSLLAKSQTLNIDKAKKLLGYEPIVSMEEGLKRYADWYKS